MVVGIALAAWVLRQAGVDNVLSLMQRGGAKLVLVVLFHAVQIVLAAAAWWTVARVRQSGPPLRFYVLLRWLREGIGSLLPSVQIGGLLVVIRLLCRRGQTFGVAAAGVIADTSVELGSQVAFALIGLWALWQVTGGKGLEAGAVSGFFAFSGVTAAVVAVQGAGGARLAERLAVKFGWRAANGFHDALSTIYRNRQALGLAALWHLSAWLLGGVEVVLAFHIFGRDVGIGTGVAVESLGQAIKTAAFAVPAALGVQEGGYVLVCGLLGLPADLALALSLTKRLRDLAFGIPSIALWLWQERKDRGS
jgi:putative membrane protein